ncbi:RNA polymerase ECF-type sigma factor [Fulvivirga imtechensis AK7]|uniref:RNA polymerase ECF-type sigma factor n=2 Tax=Fulvivirga TaxID=396811 RepID=L8JKD9_9BACT|nr:RNA polymerase ECF-type sigma factor [Fulvivirga imtechensis AK7]
MLADMQENAYSEFESLFKQHHKGLCDLAFNIVRDPDAAKDIVQEVFLKLWKNRESVAFEKQIKHYLFKATAHTSLNYLRFNKRLVRFDNGAPLQELVAHTDSEGAGYKELELRARQAIDRLPPKCKTIYLLSRHEGMKYSEIAETLDLSIKTVENQMGIALQKLRDELKPFLTIEFLTIILLTWFALSLLF